MKKIDELFITAKVKAIKAKEKFLSKENGDSQLVVALVLIAVAVGLCIIFRNKISEVMSKAFSTTDTKIQNLLDGDLTGDLTGAVSDNQ